MTTGRRFAQRTKDQRSLHLIDARTKAVLQALATEPRGKAVQAYLRASGLDKA